MAVSVLMIAEKPSLADSISKILSKGTSTPRKGISNATKVFEHTGKFMGKDANFKITSTVGHVFNVDFPREFNNWDVVDPESLFQAPIEKLEATPKAHIVSHLQKEAKDIDYLVLWLDCDREGENICFEVTKCCKASMKPPPKGSKNDRIYRAKFSAITDIDITNAMKALVRPNENEAKAVDVRQGKYGNLDSSCISFGPCQTPTLALCVQRHDEIQSFISTPFWTLNANIKAGSSSIALTSDRGRIFDKSKCAGLSNSLKKLSSALLVDIAKDKKSTQRPHALNTVELLKAASSGLGISPSDTMREAEYLYINGYISYPRTETSKYPEHFDINELLRIQSKHPLWGDYAKSLLNDGYDRPTGGIDVGDHPPITPIALADEAELGGNSWRLYDLIARHFLGSISSNCHYIRTKATFRIGNETFTLSGNVVTNPGFTGVMHWKAASDQQLPGDLEKDSEYPVTSFGIKEGQTSPPDYLSESDLIGLMEKNGIGTDASMAVHINNISQRRRTLVPTNLGIIIIHGLSKIDPDLATPKLRSEMEQKISQIARGEQDWQVVLEESIQTYLTKFQNFTSKIGNMDVLFESTFSPLSSSGKSFSKCGRCRRYMFLINLRPVRLHCRNCNETYPLPSSGGTIKLYKELVCPLDSFELVLWSTGSHGKGMAICPQCYNNPPFVGIPAGMGCNDCLDANCLHSLVSNSIVNCPTEACEGVLVLDGTSAPRYKMGCNRCNLVSSFNDTVNDVQVKSDTLCADCFAKKIKVSFMKKENRSDLVGCIVCDDELDSLLETRVVRVGRFRGRGRGKRRGRGRGRGKSNEFVPAAGPDRPKTEAERGQRRGRGKGRRGRGSSEGDLARPQERSMADFFSF